MTKVQHILFLIFSLFAFASVPCNAQGLLDNTYPAEELPQSLPYTVNGTTYEHVIVWPQGGADDHWIAYYNGSLTWTTGWPPFLTLPVDNICFYQSSPAAGSPGSSNASCSSVPMYTYPCNKTYFSDVDIVAAASSVILATSGCSDIYYSASDVIIEGRPVPQEFSFPYGPAYGETSLTAEVSAVQDHSMASPYTKDGIVLAFNGEEGQVGNGCEAYPGAITCNSGNYTSYPVVGFENSLGTSFFPGGILYYPGGPLGTNDTFLYYDGHPGYDYPKVDVPSVPAPGANISSPIHGTLCVATPTTTPAAVWRDMAECELPGPIAASWGANHAFYILADNAYINGQVGDYAILFLHSDSLESSIATAITNDGYAIVNRWQHIAEVGDIGATPGAYHMHIEVFKRDPVTPTNWNRVDPYGNGSTDILWRN